jgi:hypothetical protein
MQRTIRGIVVYINIKIKVESRLTSTEKSVFGKIKRRTSVGQEKNSWYDKRALG